VKSYLIFWTAPDSQPEYALSGEYGFSNDGARIYYSVILAHLNGAQVFANIQSSSDTPDELFILGEEGGDADNVLGGGLSGGLASDAGYRLFLTARIRNPASDVAHNSATATGCLTLTVTDSSYVIPEPSTLVIWTLLGVFCISVGWGRRRRKTG